MKIWIYIDGAQKGPFGEDEILAMNIEPSTPVWFEGMPKWLPAGEVPEMAALLRGETPAETPSGEAATPAVESPAEPSADAPAEAEATVVEEVIVEKVVEKPVSKYAPGRRAPRRSELPDEPCPPTYLGWSVFLTVCCCSPVSLASLAASIFVTSYYNSGKLEKSRKASEIAAWLIMIAIALGFMPVMLMSVFTGN